jgi:hypothetical protein
VSGLHAAGEVPEARFAVSESSTHCLAHDRSRSGNVLVPLASGGRHECFYWPTLDVEKFLRTTSPSTGQGQEMVGCRRSMIALFEKQPDPIDQSADSLGEQADVLSRTADFLDCRTQTLSNGSAAELV